MHIVVENEIAVATGRKGTYDVGHWSDVLRELDGLDRPAVVDVRQIESGLSEIDAYLLALHAEEMQRLSAHRLALVTSGEPNCYAAFFAVCARNRGLDVEVFADIAAASAWAGSPAHD